jgi:hypothetical protein
MDTALSGIHPWGIWLGLSLVAVSLPKFATEIAKGLFL